MTTTTRRSLTWISALTACVLVGWFALSQVTAQVRDLSDLTKQKDNVKSVLALLASRQRDAKKLHGRQLLLSLVPDDARVSAELPELDRMAGPRAGSSDTVDIKHPFRGVPLVGLANAGGAVIGFSSGEVRYLDKAELGLDDSDPITFGAPSKSPLLRMLSDE